MNQDLINRYQAGGDIYNSLVAKYGQATADACAQAALSGDESQINAALVQSIYGSPLDTSTTDAFLNQLETNPLGAPLNSLGNILTNTVDSLFANKIILVVAVAGLFLALGGVDVLRNQIKKI